METFEGTRRERLDPPRLGSKVRAAVPLNMEVCVWLPISTLGR